MPNTQLKYWIAFSCMEKVGPATFKKLSNYFNDDLQKAWEADLENLLMAGLRENLATYVQAQKQNINPDQELEKLDKLGVSVVTIKDKHYPKLLAETYNPPAVLYYKGRLEDDRFSLAVVGTRKITSYGRQITPEIVKPLAQNGVTIVSGLALGVDALAHKSCLEIGGRTVAVLGSGVDRIYPAANSWLAEQIIEEGGAVVSEYPLGTAPLKHHFPNRNRIISGLSLGVIIAEGAEDSGSLITAKYALDQNREIFAVPGDINKTMAQGPNKMIKMGAKMITCAADVLEELNLTNVRQFVENKKVVPETPEETVLLQYLSKESVHIDKLIKCSKLDAQTVSSALILMEMKGSVRNLGGHQYVVSH